VHSCFFFFIEVDNLTQSFNLIGFQGAVKQSKYTLPFALLFPGRLHASTYSHPCHRSILAKFSILRHTPTAPEAASGRTHIRRIVRPARQKSAGFRPRPSSNIDRGPSHVQRLDSNPSLRKQERARQTSSQAPATYQHSSAARLRPQEHAPVAPLRLGPQAVPPVPRRDERAVLLLHAAHADARAVRAGDDERGAARAVDGGARRRRRRRGLGLGLGEERLVELQRPRLARHEERRRQRSL
jgi:hypothetical protein